MFTQKLNGDLKQNKRSILKVFIIFMLGGGLLFIALTFLIIIPKINQHYDSLGKESDQVAAHALAGKLEQYIYSHQLALGDVASNPLVIRATLLAEGNNPAFLDFINHARLLGHDPEFTLIDALGDVLFTENNEKTDDKWALAILSEASAPVMVNINNVDKPKLYIAVPVVYGRKAEGILIARMNAEPDLIYSEKEMFNNHTAVVYEKNGQRISSDVSHIQRAKQVIIELKDYGIVFTYIVDAVSVEASKKMLTKDILVTCLVGGLLMFILLFLFGRRVIVQPFEALADSQQAIASAVEGISRVDTNGCYITLNHAYANIAGYEPEELEGEPWARTVYPDDLPVLEDAYQTMLKEGKVIVEARGVKKDGTVFYKHLTMISLYDENNSFIGHHCFMQDITERKVSEEKIRKQQHDLQLIFDNVPVKIWYKDDKNRILRLNKKAAESMGGEVADFEGKSTYDLFPEMAAKYHQDDLTVIESNTPLLGIVEEYTPIGGERLWISTDKVPCADVVTQESFLLVCAQDITALKQAELEKNQLIDQLSHSNSELEQFAHVASHDLKAPLRGIEQLASWIRQDCEGLLPDASLKHLGLMSKRVSRMRNLLDDLLEYSHASHIDLSKQEIDLKAVLNDLVDLRVLPFGFKCTLNVPDGNILIARKPFEIIVRNLLDNALKHHDKEQGEVKIKYTTTREAHIIEVSDDGPGIPPNMHEKVFEMFQTLQARDKKEGSGTGLALIKKLLYRYGGEITLDSDGIRGTTFKIIWPYEHKVGD